MIYYQPQSYIIISYKVVYGENSSSVFLSKFSMVLINDSPYRRGSLMLYTVMGKMNQYWSLN